MTALTSLLLGALIWIGHPISLSADHKADDLPTLHVINHVSLGPAYSCRSAAEFASGYQDTALFVSGFSRRQNAPDLLFNGACKSVNYFQSSTAGDDMALIGDLGPNVPLGSVSASRAFNWRNLAGTEHETRFTQSAPVVLGHTYVVLLNKCYLRGLIVFTVTAFEPDKRVELDYAVKGYEILTVDHRSDGWDWVQESGNQ